MKQFYTFLSVVLLATTFSATAQTTTSNYTAKPISVSATKQVLFSNGNLRCKPADTTFYFAEQQNSWMSQQVSIRFIGGLEIVSWGSEIDLFGWSSDNTAATDWGISWSTTAADFYGTFIDWGENAIGTDTVGTLWHTLTYDEWNYIFNERTNAASKYSLATVNDVKGLLILPDDWLTWVDLVKYYGARFTPQAPDYTTNTYTETQWAALEKRGAVFLPACGKRNGTSATTDLQVAGAYWTSTRQSAVIGGNPTAAYAIVFYSNSSSTVSRSIVQCHSGLSVRLVKDYVLYTVIVNSSTNGTITANKATAVDGTTITLTIAPATGYELDQLTVKQGEAELTLTKVDDTHYTFTMPKGNVEVTASFKGEEIGTGNENVAAETIQATKIMVNGQVRIVRNGCTYTILGEEIR